MALKTLARNPQFAIKMISGGKEIPFEQLRPSVIDFTVNHRMGDAAGSFSITLLPRKPDPFYGQKSWVDIINPMDYVEIWAWVPPDVPDPPMAPLIRGFVDSIGERLSIGGGQPQRHIQVTGRDFGKIALISSLYYLQGADVSIEIAKRWKKGFDKLGGNDSGGEANTKPPASSDLPEPADDAITMTTAPDGTTTVNMTLTKTIAAQNVGPASGPTFSPLQVMQVVYDEFFAPAQSDIIGWRFPGVRFHAQVDEWEERLRTYSPGFNLHTCRPLSDMWTLFRTFQHWPWRELFFEEGPTSPLLIYRPTPWLDLQGQRIQPWADSVIEHKITDANISDVSSARSDAHVKNYFFTTSWIVSIAQMAKQMPALLEGSFIQPFKGNPYLIGYSGGGDIEQPEAPSQDRSGDPSAYQRFGFRVREEYTPYLNMERGLTQDRIKEKLRAITAVGLEANTRLARAFGYEELMENGTLVLRGDPHIRIGHYLRRTDHGGSQHYAEGVTQYFRQGSTAGNGLFQTTVSFTRGRGHLVRTGRSI